MIPNQSTYFVALLAAANLCGSGLSAQASLTGRVLTESPERPITNAEILIPARNLSTRSDSSGKFRILGIVAGNVEVLVRHPGYQAAQSKISFVGSTAVEADFILSNGAVALRSVDVSADRNNAGFAVKLAEFDERRASKIGKFLTAEEIMKHDGRPISSFLGATIPGVRFTMYNGKRVLTSSRGGKSDFDRQVNAGAPVVCYTRIIVNGRVEFEGTVGQALYDVDSLNSLDVIGFEYYTAATTPLKYNSTGGGSCGTAVIWTKGG